MVSIDHTNFSEWPPLGNRTMSCVTTMTRDEQKDLIREVLREQPPPSNSLRNVMRDEGGGSATITTTYLLRQSATALIGQYIGLRFLIYFIFTSSCFSTRSEIRSNRLSKARARSG